VIRKEVTDVEVMQQIVDAEKEVEDWLKLLEYL
jgi:hypothetical protein